MSQLPIKRRGLTEFTFSRYLVPWLCDFRGPAIFMDADMLCLDDIDKLMAHWSPAYAVQVVKNPLRYEWPSLMLFNCQRCHDLKPHKIDDEDFKPQSLGWGSVGDLPAEWNHLVGYDEPKKAKLVHFTQGIPLFPEVKDCEYANEWKQEAMKANSSCSWEQLMGSSVHAASVLARVR